jgi:NAD(P)-dependent dehydrogenase (short-subunit alcohol dehydrogenase family)
VYEVSMDLVQSAPPTLDLRDRVALVTGGGRGIGAATSRMLARCGAMVAVNYLANRERAARVADEITAGGGKAVAVAADVADPAQAAAMVEEAGDLTAAPSYGASKGGVNALTKSMARELGPDGIPVNAVAPHAAATEMSADWPPARRREIERSIPLGRLGTPDEVAGVIAFLASDLATFVTGEIVDVNGGAWMG